MSNSRNSYNDLYIPRDGVGTGHLTIAGKDTLLKLLNSQPLEDIDEEDTDEAFRDHHGLLKDGSKVSLLECIRTGSTNYRLDERAQYETHLFPHYVLVGESFINSGEAAIQAIHYHFENVHCLVRGYRTFGTIRPGREEFRKILEADHQRREEIAQEHDWRKPKFEPEIGDNPTLLYFNGLWEIVKCSAQIGSVTLTNRTSYEMGSSKGIGIDNEITVSLEFAAPKTVDEAFTSLGTLHSFFELCLGRHQRYLWIEAQLVREEAETDDRMAQSLEVYWSNCNERTFGETDPTHYGDVLLDPGVQKAEFAKVLSGWLDSAPSMGEARSRFAGTLHSDVYGKDRIVGAANMFDLLPDTHVPSKKELNEETRDAVKESRERFKVLPDSFARQSMLSALGRVGTASLRDKICHRADILTKADSKKFAELHLPCSQAVLCRNRYVHGSEAAFNYSEEFKAFIFLTDTLEFVFAASDLIELGWDYNSWCEKRPLSSHNFGSYVVNYERNLQILKQLLNA